MSYHNPFGTSEPCFKSNLHTHSTTSDGKFSPRELARLYCDAGYDIIALSDHYKTNQSDFTDGIDILNIGAMEYHPVGPRGIRLHLVALSVPVDFENPSELPYQEAIETVREAGGESILAHPYWSGLNSDDIMKINNIIGIEVYNTSTRYIGKALNMQIWDNILDLGKMLPAVAVDDTHNPKDLFRGWSIVCAQERSPEAVLDALCRGAFYSSMGPEFFRLEFDGEYFNMECSAVEEIIFIGARNLGRCGGTDGFDAVIDNEGRLKTEKKSYTACKMQIPSGFRYVRCQVVDSRGRYAWSNPFEVA